MYTESYFSTFSGATWISIVENLSVMLASYHLIWFYFALHSLLDPYGPVPKFLCIKAVLFFSFWQTVVMDVLLHYNIIRNGTTYDALVIGTGFNNGIIICEMTCIALAHG